MTTQSVNLGRRIWKAWLDFGHWLGDVMSWVWMPLFYYGIATPFALYVRFVLDPLRACRKPQPSYWEPKTLPPPDLDWARSQGSVVMKKSLSSVQRSEKDLISSPISIHELPRNS